MILGEGDLRPALERQIKELRLDKHVLLPGFRADILAFIRSFDLFVMSSLAEGLGTSLLDAMALSKATVASDTGGIPEVVSHGETGFLVTPRDHRGARCGHFRVAEKLGPSRANGESRSRASQTAVHRRADGREDTRRLTERTPGDIPNTRVTQITQRAARITLRAVKPALIGHTKMANRKIVLHRVERVQLAQRRRDIRGHSPTRTRITGQAKTPSDANDVRVERNDQLRGWHVLPEPEIDCVVPDHPSQIQIQPLARTAARRARKKVTRRPDAACDDGRPGADRPRAHGLKTIPSAPEISPAAGSYPSRKKASIDPRSSICWRMIISAVKSSPFVQR